MGSLRLFPLVLALLLCFSSTRTAVATTSDLLAQLPASLFAYCGPQIGFSTYSDQTCLLSLSALKSALPRISLPFKSLVETSLSRIGDKFLLPLHRPGLIEQPNLANNFDFPIHGASMAILMTKTTNNPYYIRLSVAKEDRSHKYDCWIEVGQAKQNKAECSSPASGSSTISISWSSEVKDIVQGGNKVRIAMMSFMDPTSKLLISGLPSTLTQQHAYLISFAALDRSVVEEDRASRRDSQEVQYELLDNNSSPASSPSIPSGFLADQRIVGLTIAAIVLVVILIILIAVVVINGKKSGNAPPPGGSTMSTAMTDFNSGGMDSKGEVPSSFVVGSSTTASTGSPSPSPYSPISAVSGSPNSPSTNSPNSLHFNPLPGATGGIISASMGSALRGGQPTATPSPGPETPLQGAVGSAAQTAASSTFSPRMFNASPAPTARTGFFGSLRPKKQEKVALADAPLLLSPKFRGPAVVSNQILASLPNEPGYVVKPTYLLTALTPRSPPAKKQIHYKDLIAPKAKQRTGTLRGANKLKMSRSSSAEELGDLDSFMGDADGPSGLFVDADDEWLNDIVEPSPDDPTYQNEENYEHIDLDSMSLAPLVTGLDSSVESLEAHINGITSPLSKPPPSSLSRSSSAPGLPAMAASNTATSVTESLSVSSSDIQDIPVSFLPTSNPSSPRMPLSSSDSGTDLPSSTTSSTSFASSSASTSVRSWTKAKAPGR